MVCFCIVLFASPLHLVILFIHALHKPITGENASFFEHYGYLLTYFYMNISWTKMEYKI